MKVQKNQQLPPLIVVSAQGSTQLLGFTQTSTFFEIKKELEKTQGIRIDQQILQLADNSEIILHDEKPLSEYGLLRIDQEPV
jgi:hypothetical protein